jgi:hypothetical protein
MTPNSLHPVNGHLTDFNPETFTDCRITTSSVTGQQIGRGSINGVAVSRDTLIDSVNRDLDSVGNPGVAACLGLAPGNAPASPVWPVIRIWL